MRPPESSQSWRSFFLLLASGDALWLPVVIILRFRSRAKESIRSRPFLHRRFRTTHGPASTLHLMNYSVSLPPPPSSPPLSSSGIHHHLQGLTCLGLSCLFFHPLPACGRLCFRHTHTRHVGYTSEAILSVAVWFHDSALDVYRSKHTFSPGTFHFSINSHLLCDIKMIYAGMKHPSLL